MRILLRIVVASTCCLLISVGYADDAYLCVTRMVTGFSYDKARHSWHATDSQAGRKYLVSRSRAQGVRWEVLPVGDIVPSALCKEGFSKAGTLTCRGFDEFKMNRNNGRFIHAYLVGYWTDNHGGGRREDPSLFAEGENAPFLEMGECSAM